MKTVTIEEHASVPELYDAIGGPQIPKPLQAILNDMGEGRLAAMDEAGIDMQVLSMQPPIPTETIDIPKVDAAVKRFNDAAAEAVAAHPTRFAAFAVLPVHDPNAAAAELERAVKELGMVGALIGTNMTTGFVEEEVNWAIWEAAESLGVPIYMHPGLPPKAVFDAYYADLGPILGIGMSTAIWGWHVDTGLHTVRTIVRGVYDRFPNLQVIIGHMGEAVPFMLGRLEERFAGIGESIEGFAPPFKRPIREYFRDNIHLSTSGFFDNESLICAISAVGADRIMLAVDYPFSKNLDGRRFIDNAPISEEDRNAIAHGNAERLLGLAT
jgi:predicted TIM-barrel fold metal-dependent hydrolase